MIRALWPHPIIGACHFPARQASAFALRSGVTVVKRRFRTAFKPHQMIQDKDEFHRYTRGRFVQDEAEQMASRYLHFQVDELAKVAASAVGSQSCVDIEKCADGMYNKAFLLTMNDGQQVIAKLPNPNAGLPHFTTASEVATMKFMRTILSIPVPKVYAYCNHADQTPVEAEYIIMEKAAGVPLKAVWPTMDLKARFALVKNLIKYQSAWSDVDYPGFGSIYFAADVPKGKQISFQPNEPGLDQSAAEVFTLGTITGREWSDDGRDAVSLDRGPWRSLEEYMEALGQRELTCVNEVQRLPVPHVTLCGPGTYQPTREKKIRAIQMYLKVLPAIIPADQAITKPTAWHPDLHAENIFVDPSAPTNVTAIIDWQSTEVTPSFFQARQPYVLDYDGPQAEGLEQPQLPDNVEELPTEEKEAAGRLLFNQAIAVAYKRWIKGRHPDIWKSIEFMSSEESFFVALGHTLLIDGEVLYAARVVEVLQSNKALQSSHSTLKSTGLRVSDSDIADIEADVDGALRGMEAMRELRDALGPLCPEKGCVKLEHYDATKEALRNYKQQIIEHYAKTDADRAAWEESWPFDD